MYHTQRHRFSYTQPDSREWPENAIESLREGETTPKSEGSKSSENSKTMVKNCIFLRARRQGDCQRREPIGQIDRSLG